MAVYRTGQGDSGIDKALQRAQDAELDDVLQSGEMFDGELANFPEPVPTVISDRPWQLAIGAERKPPASERSLWSMVKVALGLGPKAPPDCPDDKKEQKQRGTEVRGVSTPSSKQYEDAKDKATKDWSAKKRYFMWRREGIGIVMIHGIGPQLAGQTLLDWTRPIVTLLEDVAAGHKNEFAAAPDERRPSGATVTDPVVKANIDFSGHTFPVLTVRIPARTHFPDGQALPKDDPRGKERTWVFTETWWATEVRAPTLPTMISWLGEQGGVGRIVQGIQRNMAGSGAGSMLGRISLQPLVSVITSFVLLLFLLLLGISKVIPFGPLRDAVVLSLASSFLTDWFGGARTLLRDAPQSANVRYRLQLTIKALRAYGCRNVVIVAHSGGTMVSLTTLTDPAFPKLRVQKLITIGEALNLGWRLNAANPDTKPTTPPAGDRMAVDIGALQKNLQWRDFWGTHDPAPSGQPQLPETFKSHVSDPPRFTAERVYNRMSILEDHGGYWDNDEHFLIPLIREIDVPTGDRAASRFYSDQDESAVRYRRKERVSLLAFGRKALLSLPIVAILAAATVTAPGFVPNAGDFAFQVFGLIPGNQLAAQLADSFVAFMNSLSLSGFPALPDWLQAFSLGPFLYNVGLWALQAFLILLVLFSIVPGRFDRLWGDRQKVTWQRVAILAVDVAVGLGVFVALLIDLFFFVSPADRDRILASIPVGNIVVLVIVGIVLAVLGWLGTNIRRNLRETQAVRGFSASLPRNILISASAIFLGFFLVTIVGLALGILLVLIDGSPEHRDTERFVVGAIVVLVAFNILARLGTWRWDVWDVRERRFLRRRPGGEPQRVWPYTLLIILTAIAFASAIVVALGTDGWSWLGISRDGWLVLIGLAIVAVVLLCLGKDIVDNDIAVAAGPEGGKGGPGQVSPPAASTPSG